MLGHGDVDLRPESADGHHAAAPPGLELLAHFHDRELRPYLSSGGAGPLANPQLAESILRSLAAGVAEPLAAAVNTWRRLCEERRSLDHQRRLHGWLHGWLLVHVPATVALLALLVGHVFAACRHAAWQGW